MVSGGFMYSAGGVLMMLLKDLYIVYVPQNGTASYIYIKHERSMLKTFFIPFSFDAANNQHS